MEEFIVFIVKLPRTHRMVLFKISKYQINQHPNHNSPMASSSTVLAPSPLIFQTLKEPGSGVWMPP